MRLCYGSILAVLLVAPCLAVDPPAPKSTIILPVAPKPDTPVPPLPANVIRLVDDQVFDIVTTGPVAWRWHPAGIVSITKREVPAGRDFEKEANFWDGAKSKVYPGPCTVHFIKAAATNNEPQTTELDLIPIGLTDEKQIISLSITVNAQNPIPPPKPVDPKVDPKPVEPVVKSPWDNSPGLRVMIVYPKRGSLPAAQQAIVTGAKVRTYLDAKCVKENNEAAYWILKTDEDASGLPAPWQKAYARTKGDRWYVVGNGAKWEEGPLPDGADAMLAILKKYSGE
jgi:hypothetical protein